MRRWTAAHGKIRLFYLLGPRLDEYEGDAVSKRRVCRGIQPPPAGRRVSDEDWIRPAIKRFSVILTGEAKAFPVQELTAARQCWT